jgi:septal ring-binding cell division protein DamX
MRAAGYKGPDVFSPSAIAAITRASSGLSRRINVLCDKALLAAFAANTHGVTPREVRAAVADSDFAPVAGPGPRVGRAIAAAALLACGAAVGAGLYYWLDREQTQPAPIARATVTPATVAPPAAVAPTPTAAPSPAPNPPVAEPVRTEAPAEKPLAPPAPMLSADQLRRFDGYVPGRNPLLRERLAATRERLVGEPDGSYSVALFVAENSDPERTERFLMRARELVPLPEVNVIPIASSPRYRLLVTYGVFGSKESAAEAAKRLPPKYQNAFKLELRGMAELRAAI